MVKQCHFGIVFGSVLGHFAPPIWVHFGSIRDTCWAHFGCFLEGLAQSSPKVVPSGAISEPIWGIGTHGLTMVGPVWSHVAPNLTQVGAFWSHVESFWEPAEVILGCFFDDGISMCFFCLPPFLLDF